MNLKQFRIEAQRIINTPIPPNEKERERLVESIRRKQGTKEKFTQEELDFMKAERIADKKDDTYAGPGWGH